MPKERTDPVTDEDGDERHPAFGLISVHRISASPGEVVFQSDLRHPEYVRIDVHEATRKRDLAHDWVHPGKVVCEVSMSMAQFASFVASGGTSGVPCTIEFTGGGEHGTGHRPGLNPAPRLQASLAEVRDAAGRVYAGVQEALARYEEALADTGKGSAARHRAALASLRSTLANAAPSMEFAARSLDRHAEEVVERSRADIEAMMVRTAERLGIPVAEVRAIEQ